MVAAPAAPKYRISCGPNEADAEAAAAERVKSEEIFNAANDAIDIGTRMVIESCEKSCAETYDTHCDVSLANKSHNCRAKDSARHNVKSCATVYNNKTFTGQIGCANNQCAVIHEKVDPNCNAIQILAGTCK